MEEGKEMSGFWAAVFQAQAKSNKMCLCRVLAWIASWISWITLDKLDSLDNPLLVSMESKPGCLALTNRPGVGLIGV